MQPREPEGLGVSLPRREHMRRACSRVHALVRIVASPIMFTCVAYMVVATLSCLFVSVQGMTPKAAPPAKPAFAYGLPGNFNAVGGEELNFDPAGFLEGKTEVEVNRYRECELTHGRVGMLASAGFLVQEKFHPLFSGDGGPAIDQIPQLPIWLWVVMAGGIGAAEAYRIDVAFQPLEETPKGPKAKSALRSDYTPGDLGFDPLGLAPEDPAEFAEMQEKELAHCRLAMIAAAGFLAQEAVTKATWGTVYGLPDF